MVEELKEAGGKPWKVIGKFENFKGADILRQGILLEADESVEVKVKKMATCFVVKMRAKEEESQPKKEKKSKKFKKGNKKKK